MECELCGKDFSQLKSVNVEGSLLLACYGCAAHGVENKVYKPRKSYSDYSPFSSGMPIAGNLDLAENYGMLIKKARESRKWTIDDLAKKISLKNSTMQKIENQSLKPEDKYVPKLESLLGIRLKKTEQ
ncbi:MAG: TIGR00270 family protein [Candidatus Diapherotrites archaeon CG08_land_8_20_14_0_20_34_12]|nr:MAG: TIGR00270 family protein [Candidatus Diapherotrites archaeon CG08_land_8_20_14_0_20_34_12]